MKNIVWGLIAAIGIQSNLFAVSGVAELKGTAANSPISGTVYFQELPNGLKITANLSGVPAGQHGFHIHEFGSCADLGKAAGSHYNPMSAPHGQILKGGVGHAHAGDLGNVTAGADGKASIDAMVPGITLTGSSMSVAGRAVILHEKADDFSQPVGNAGGRIGCAPIVLSTTTAAVPATAPK